MEAQEGYTPQPPRRGASLKSVILISAIFGLVAGFIGTFLASWVAQTGRFPFASNVLMPPGVTISNTKAPESRFEGVAAALNESVVNIDTRVVRESPLPFYMPDQVMKGSGTGMIIDKNGYILTNYHVIEDAQNIQVTVTHADGKRMYKATLVGGDAREDLALLRIDAKNLKPVSFGNSSNVHPGEWVMAIGNPYGEDFEHTVSVGVISALNRLLPNENDSSAPMRNMIQTDASINPGNSGGPLVDLAGNVIGINSAIFIGRSSSGVQASGLGFAIPSNRAVQVIEQLRKGLTVPHPYIGIGYNEITDEVRTSLHLPSTNGVIVQNVSPNSPAQSAGVMVGDIISGIDGKAITDKNVIGNYITQQDVGKVIHLEIKRWNDANGRWDNKSITVKIGNQPASVSPASTQSSPDSGQQDQVAVPWPF